MFAVRVYVVALDGVFDLGLSAILNAFQNRERIDSDDWTEGPDPASRKTEAPNALLFRQFRARPRNS